MTRYQLVIFKKAILATVAMWLILPVYACAANAEIYEWTDMDGTRNFVDDKDKIPAKYPVKVFQFDNDKKWSVDQSDTKAGNQQRLDTLKSREVKSTTPQMTTTTTIIIEQPRRAKWHRND